MVTLRLSTLLLLAVSPLLAVSSESLPSPTGTSEKIPIIDISPLISSNSNSGGDAKENDLKVLSRSIRDALSTVGFFYVSNHAVPSRLVRRAFAYSRSFFSLPTEEKLSLGIERSGAALKGYTPPYGETVDAANRTKDIKESYDLGPEAKDGEVRPFFGPTPWPEEKNSSRPDLAGFRAVMTEYHSEMVQLARTVLRAVALSLDLPLEYFDGMMKEPVGIQRLLHYPRQHTGNNNGKDEDGRETFGAGPHTDYGCLTVLAQDSVGGLQVLDRSTRQWIPAPPIEDTFVVNIGDMIQRLTNNYYVANSHRVVSVGIERYSMPFFFDVDYDTVFEPLEQFVTDSRPAQYLPTKCGDHKWQRYKESYPYLREKEEEKAIIS